MPNFSSLARLEVPEKFLWVVGGVCKVIFVSNPTVVLCCVGVLTTAIMNIGAGNFLIKENTFFNCLIDSYSVNDLEP